jgi:hypothetical protein
MLDEHSGSWLPQRVPSDMNEYQAEQLFERFNMATPEGAPVETPEAAEKIATSLNGAELMVKAQIHASWPPQHPSKGMPEKH